jgi:hypothetical protein
MENHPQLKLETELACLVVNVSSRNTSGGSITVQLTSCLTLD